MYVNGHSVTPKVRDRTVPQPHHLPESFPDDFIAFLAGIMIDSKRCDLDDTPSIAVPGREAVDSGNTDRSSPKTESVVAAVHSCRIINLLGVMTLLAKVCEIDI